MLKKQETTQAELDCDPEGERRDSDGRGVVEVWTEIFLLE